MYRYCILSFIFIVFCTCQVDAGVTQSLGIDFEGVPAIEIKGYWDKSNIFVASSILKLPEKRSLKLRGQIQDTDYIAQTITLFGLEIKLTKNTKVTDIGNDKYSFSKLKVGKYIEAKCNKDENGYLIIRKIKVEDVKSENRIKGTITRFNSDGTLPDTIYIEGLPVELTDFTKIHDSSDFFSNIEDELFDELALGSARANPDGFILNDNFYFNANYRQTVKVNNEFDLSDRFDTDYNEFEPQFRLEMTGFWNNKFRSFAQLRLRKRFFINSDTLLRPTDDFDIKITQLYLLAYDIGVSGLTFQIGRQDFDEPREWLFDEYLDAVRLYYYGKRPFVFEAALIHSVLPLKDKYETWTDMFTQVRWYHNKNSFVRGYFLKRKDSDDLRNMEPLWLGIGYYGEINNQLKSWLELALMRGEDKGQKKSANAVDIGITYTKSNLIFNPSVSLSYAFGSGDKSGADQVSNEFRQTGYDDNVDYLSGANTIRYYGEVLNPELTNLNIFTLGFGFKPTKKSSIEIVYHSYKQHYPDDELKAKLYDDISTAIPNGISKDIGWELDTVFGISNLWQVADLSWVFALFKPGQAFNQVPGSDLNLETATLNRLNLKVDF